MSRGYHNNIILLLLLAFALVSLFTLRDTSIVGKVVQLFEGPGDYDPSVVLNLTFDDPNDPWKDYSQYNHEMTPQGDVAWADRTICKWYGCADLRATSGDYLSTLSLFNLSEGIAISFWVYRTTDENVGYYQIGEADTLKWSEEGSYGVSSKWTATSGIVGSTPGASDSTPTGQWTHYFMLYDTQHYSIWKNAILINNLSQSFGEIRSQTGENVFIGSGLYGMDVEGYLDEFVIFENREVHLHKVYTKKPKNQYKLTFR